MFYIGVLSYFGIPPEQFTQVCKHVVPHSLSSNAIHNRLRAVPLQSVKSKLGRTGESFPSAFARFARFSRSRFPRSRDHPKGLLAV